MLLSIPSKISLLILITGYTNDDGKLNRVRHIRAMCQHVNCNTATWDSSWNNCAATIYLQLNPVGGDTS